MYLSVCRGETFLGQGTCLRQFSFLSLSPCPPLSPLFFFLVFVGRQIFYTEAAPTLLPSQVSLPPPPPSLTGCHRRADVDVFILEPQTRVNAVILGIWVNVLVINLRRAPRVIPDAGAV